MLHFCSFDTLVKQCGEGAVIDADTVIKEEFGGEMHCKVVQSGTHKKQKPHSP